MCLNDCVLPEDVFNKAEQVSNSLILIVLVSYRIDLFVYIVEEKSSLQ
jgi:hypothetical protein